MGTCTSLSAGSYGDSGLRRAWKPPRSPAGGDAITIAIPRGSATATAGGSGGGATAAALPACTPAAGDITGGGNGNRRPHLQQNTASGVWRARPHVEHLNAASPSTVPLAAGAANAVASPSWVLWPRARVRRSVSANPSPAAAGDASPSLPSMAPSSCRKVLAMAWRRPVFSVARPDGTTIRE